MGILDSCYITIDTGTEPRRPLKPLENWKLERDTIAGFGRQPCRLKAM